MDAFEKIVDIMDALKYRDNDKYVGSHATAQVCFKLALPYPSSHREIRAALRSARDGKIDEVYEYLESYIIYMKEHPKVICPHCGQLMDKK